MKKTKSIVSALTVAILTLPGVVFAAGLVTPSGTGLPEQSLYKIVENIMNWLLSIVGIVAVIGFAISGVMYLVAAGDEDVIKRAKSGMLYSIIGVIVALLGLVVLKIAQGLLGAQQQF